MRLILISGLGATKDGNGLIDLGIKSGVPFNYWEHDAKEITIPDGGLILSGHSLGAYRCLRIIQAIYPRKVKLFIPLDFVTPEWCPMLLGIIPIPLFAYKAKEHIRVPSNVEKCVAFQRAFHEWWPPSSRILNTSDEYRNEAYVNSGHAFLPKNPEVVDRFLELVKKA